VKLEQADFEELNSRFSLERNPSRLAKEAQPPKGEHCGESRSLPSGPMVRRRAESPPGRARDGRDRRAGGRRRVGGGRIVATRFPLTDVRIKQWKNFDGFFQLGAAAAAGPRVR